MKGQFNRMSPAQFAERIGIPLGWTVISHRWLAKKTQRRRAHGRWFKIKSDEGACYRVLRFSANLEGSQKTGTGVIVLDWPGWLQLSGYAAKTPGTLELRISKAPWWEVPFAALNHPEPAYRASSVLALISVGLGILSVVLALTLSS